MTIKKVTSNEAKKIKGKTDWKKVDSLTDNQIEKAAKEDPDSDLPTDEDLKEFKPEKRNKNKEGDKYGDYKLSQNKCKCSWQGAKR